MTAEINRLRALVNQSKRLVFFGGAGVSTASGIPDYRSMTGLNSRRYGGLSAEALLSHSCLMLEPERFFAFYREQLLHPEARPNAAHLWLRQLEEAGRLGGIITQNIDGLHRAAGSVRLYELHGSVRENTCMDCGASFRLDWMAAQTGLPRCPDCGGVVRPDICLYGEAPNPYVMRGARRVIAEADTLIVAGTSLRVEPAASLLEGFAGRNLIIINREPIPAEEKASLVIHGDVAETLAALGPPDPLPEWISAKTRS
ncbi:MAG: NAD-dependent protein deacylase [Clostridia bacterium]|nr:NAD-dependent protein deacylase [Clostridia bacterium]